jgi:hypothetical protein
MEFTVSDFDYVTLNDQTAREILFDEIYLLTNSSKLVEKLQKNIGDEFILFRTESKYDSHKRLILTHVEFHKGQEYFNIKTNKRYKCIGIDVRTGEAMLRELSGSRHKLKYSNNTKDWAII